LGGWFRFFINCIKKKGNVLALFFFCSFSEGGGGEKKKGRGTRVRVGKGQLEKGREGE